MEKPPGGFMLLPAAGLPPTGALLERTWLPGLPLPARAAAAERPASAEAKGSAAGAAAAVLALLTAALVLLPLLLLLTAAGRPDHVIRWPVLAGAFMLFAPTAVSAFLMLGLTAEPAGAPRLLLLTMKCDWCTLPALLLLLLPLARAALLPALLLPAPLLPGVLALLWGTLGAALPEDDRGLGAAQLPLLIKKATGWSPPPLPLLLLVLRLAAPADTEDSLLLSSSPCSLSLPLGVL
jgi:hypothetical protein